MLRFIPGFSYIYKKIAHFKAETNSRVQNARDTVFRGGIVVLAFGFLIWLSIFIYVVFYYTYMPAIAHTRPIYLQFKTCEDGESKLCSFPTAHVELTKRQQLLMVGQKYKISLELEMPESQANQNLGMFMVCFELSSRESTMVAHSCRSAMLHYKSPLLQRLTTLMFAPSLIFGSSEEKQYVVVEMFSDYEDDKARPVTDVYVEVHNRRIEIYSARILITAHFSGLRYVMFHWPVLSGLMGVSLVLTTLLFVVGLSWHQIAIDGPAARVTFRIADRLKAVTDETDDEFDESKGEGTMVFQSDDSDDESIEKLS